jgi:hypothetical protein
MNKNNKIARNIEKLFDDGTKSSKLFVLVGKSFKGKSYMMRYILSDWLRTGKVKFGLVFCKTTFNNDFTSFLPKDKVIEGYDEEILKKYVDNLKNIIKEKGSVPPSFLVFDDLVGVLNNQSDWFNNFMSTFRHYNINIFIAAQYLTGKKAISTLTREQTNFAIMFNSRTRRTLENLYESYGGLFPSLEEFKTYFIDGTKQQPYVAMLYSEHIDELEDNYNFIKAPAEYQKIKFEF